jgi:hypothetical protein
MVVSAPGFDCTSILHAETGIGSIGMCKVVFGEQENTCDDTTLTIKSAVRTHMRSNRARIIKPSSRNE